MKKKEIYVIVSIDSNNIYNLGIDKNSGKEVYRVKKDRFDGEGLEDHYEMESEWTKRGYESAKYFYL